METINLLDVTIATTIALLFQAMWYSPIFFGNLVKKLSHEAMSKHLIWKFFFSFIVLFVIAFFLGLMQHYMGVTSFWDGIISAGVIWLGFVVPVYGYSLIWSKKKLALFFIDIGCWLCTFLLMGTILAG